jgi:glycosyltransferase involved in cell wall biosynthesis
LIVFAGRLVWEKGADVLINAFARVYARHPAARLLIVGDGPERPRLLRLVEQHALQSSVTLAGYLARDAMEERFASASLQVVPSRWQEPFGIVAAEALMRRTPVISSDAGGLPEIVQHERTGLLVPPDDVSALAAAILRLIEDPVLGDQLAGRGREFALQNLTEEAFVDRFLSLYARIS